MSTLSTPKESQKRTTSVVIYPSQSYRPEHERASHLVLGQWLAAIQGLEFGGEYSESMASKGPFYYVPTETLDNLSEVRKLGIETEHDLLGGVVPYPFIATKAISHPLVEPSAHAPQGWSVEFSRQTADAVLPGLSAFTLDDAHAAGMRLLEKGPVRIKPVLAKAGRGQVTVHNSEELSKILTTQDADAIAEHGLVLEEHLDAVTTFSVGRIEVADLVISYCGTQRLTHDNNGEEVYGGSSLLVARGEFEDLLNLALPDIERLAVSQALVYDRAAQDCFEGFFASRRNYDIARGRDSAGRQRSGVLEQSWRIGGATSAEVAALEAFRSDPALKVTRAYSREAHGSDAGADIPETATVLFDGYDNEVGPMAKCAWVEPVAD